MDAHTIELDRDEARRLYREYKKHKHYSEPVDREIQRAYQLIAQGRTVIRALQSIVDAGLNEDGLPKLAISWAMATACECTLRPNGSAEMDCREFRSYRWADSSRWITERSFIRFPAGSFDGSGISIWRRGMALVPPIPLHLRPQRGLANYHILWEAEWKRIPPGDPMLLRRIGRSDMWLVVAAWDLTPVEQAALATRIG